MLVKPSSFVLEYAPWSQSKADTAAQCPYKFYRQYVRKADEDQVLFNADALMGQVAHTALEYILFGMAPRPALNKALTTKSLTTHEIDRMYALLPNMENFRKKFNNYRVQTSGKAPNIEQKLAVSLDGESVKFFAKKNLFFRGVLDVSMFFTKDPHALILDHKTGKQRALTHYEKQFTAYRWLLKAKYPELEGVRNAVHFVAHDTIDFFKGLQSLDPEMLRNTVVTNLNKATQETSNFNLVKPGPLCNWCGYKNIGCPAHADNKCQKRNSSNN